MGCGTCWSTHSVNNSRLIPATPSAYTKFVCRKPSAWFSNSALSSWNWAILRTAACPSSWSCACCKWVQKVTANASLNFLGGNLWMALVASPLWKTIAEPTKPVWRNTWSHLFSFWDPWLSCCPERSTTLVATVRAIAKHISWIRFAFHTNGSMRPNHISLAKANLHKIGFLPLKTTSQSVQVPTGTSPRAAASETQRLCNKTNFGFVYVPMSTADASNSCPNKRIHQRCNKLWHQQNNFKNHQSIQFVWSNDSSRTQNLASTLIKEIHLKVRKSTLIREEVLQLNFLN